MRPDVGEEGHFEDFGYMAAMAQASCTVLSLHGYSNRPYISLRSLENCQKENRKTPT